MKKLPLLFILILILAAIGCSDSDSSSDNKASPEDTVRGFLAAQQDKNIEKIESYCTTDYVEFIDLESFKEQTEGLNVKFSNISTEIVEKSENEAEVNLSFSYDIDSKVEGEDFSGNTAVTIFLIKVDNNWLINSDDSESDS